MTIMIIISSSSSSSSSSIMSLVLSLLLLLLFRATNLGASELHVGRCLVELIRGMVHACLGAVFRVAELNLFYYVLCVSNYKQIMSLLLYQVFVYKHIVNI